MSEAIQIIYAFLFLFTTALSKKDLLQLLPFPGKITWTEKEAPPETFTIKDKKQKTETPTEQPIKIDIQPPLPATPTQPEKTIPIPKPPTKNKAQTITEG